MHVAVAALAAGCRQGVVSEAAPSLLWSEQQHSWLQAMGYTLYLEGSALDAPEPVVERAPAMPQDVPAVVNRPTPSTAPASVPAPARKAPPPMAPAAPATFEAARPVAPRTSGLRLPDRLQIALLRASGCNPNDPQTRVLMESWPLAELRANPAAKRALWPQLRSLRRTTKQ